MAGIKEIDEIAFDVEFMSCVVDKADDLTVVDFDSHFSEFVGVHQSKIKQRKLSFLDLLMPQDRETIMRQICKKNSPYVYLNFYIKNKKDKLVYVHCTGQNSDENALCRLTMADVSRSVEKSEKLKAHAKEINHLIDLVTGGVCLFKVNQKMHFEALYLNEACCRFFGTSKEAYPKQVYRLDELIHPDDRSIVFQAIGSAMATKKPIDLELRVLTHKDKYIWCKMNSAIQRYDKDGYPIFHAVFTDITKVKEGEEAADRQSDLMVKLFKNLPGPMFCTELENPFILNVVSADFMKLVGYTRKELFDYYGGDLRNLMLQREIPIAEHAIRSQAEKGEKIKATYSLKTKSGNYLVIVDKRTVVDGDNGEKSTIGVLRDITSMHVDREIFDL